MKKLFLLLLIPISCSQSLISYVRTNNPAPLIEMEQILLGSGLISAESTNQQAIIPEFTAPEGTLIKSEGNLKKRIYTLLVEPNSRFEINIDTKNYHIVNPYYTSPYIVYLSDESKPGSGKFYFLIGEKAGVVKIRSYSYQGVLQEEIIYYIEIKSP